MLKIQHKNFKTYKFRTTKLIEEIVGAVYLNWFKIRSIIVKLIPPLSKRMERLAA